MNCKGMLSLQEANGQVGTRIDEADNPGIFVTASCCFTWSTCGEVDTEVLWKGQIGAIRSGLIPTLNGGGD